MCCSFVIDGSWESSIMDCSVYRIGCRLERDSAVVTLWSIGISSGARSFNGVRACWIISRYENVCFVYVKAIRLASSMGSRLLSLKWKNRNVWWITILKYNIQRVKDMGTCWWKINEEEFCFLLDEVHGKF